MCVFFAKETIAPVQKHTSPASFVTTHTVSINQSTFKVALAQTPEEQERGLGNVSSMPADAGMLFIFPTSDKYGFWMKDTLIPLDMIWLDEEKRIVYIEKEVQPESYPNIYTPDTPALYVLELNAGLVEKNNLKLGDFAQFSI